MVTPLRSSFRALALALLFNPAVGLAQTPPAEASPNQDASPAPATVPAPSAATKEPAAAAPWTSHRELAGHVLIPSSLVLDPF